MLRELSAALATALLKDSDRLLEGYRPGVGLGRGDRGKPEPRPWLPESRIDEVASALADFIDLKSPYALGHSSGMAALAEKAVALLGLPEAELATARRAGMLHDLGRSASPAGSGASRAG